LKEVIMARQSQKEKGKEESRELSVRNKQELQAEEGTREGIYFKPAVDIYETDKALVVLADVLAAELAHHGPPPTLPPALRDAPAVPTPDDATAADWVQALLTPVRAGLVLARADLARAAHDLDLGARVGERAFVLRNLLDQDARAVLGWLAQEARRQAGALDMVEATGGADVADWWRARLHATATLLEDSLEANLASSLEDSLAVDVTGAERTGS
jgi:hypothetical protein